MPTVRDGGVVRYGVRCVRVPTVRRRCEVCEVCEVCQQSETEVWCGVRCVRCANSQRQRCGVVCGV